MSTDSHTFCIRRGQRQPPHLQRRKAAPLKPEAFVTSVPVTTCVECVLFYPRSENYFALDRNVSEKRNLKKKQPLNDPSLIFGTLLF